MANEYIINYYSNVTGSTPIASKVAFTINPRTVDAGDTSLVLYGKGAASYGQGLQENLVYLLENFCNSTPPINPTEGQLWYDHRYQILHVCTSTTVSSSSAVRIGTWSPVGAPTVLATDPTVSTSTQPSSVGQLWFDTVSRILFVSTTNPLFPGSGTQYIWARVVGDVLSNTNPNPPTTPTPGTLWFNTTAQQLEYWDGTNWQVIVNTSTAVGDSMVYAIALG